MTAIKDQINLVKKFPEMKTTAPLIKFVRAGEGAKEASSTRLKGLLSQARDWVSNFDLPELRLPGSKYIFPQDVCATPLKMDGHIISRQARICIGIELTVPMEQNITTRHNSKLQKYENELRFEAQKNHWRFHSIILEVGARGWIPFNVTSSLNLLGLSPVTLHIGCPGMVIEGRAGLSL